MVIFKIIRYFIELLVRINLITENNRHHFVWVIYLAITEFLLRYKKPHLLFLLQCMHVLKRGLCSLHALYHSSNRYFKHKLNVLLEPAKEEFVNKTPPYFLRLINPIVYFFTKTAGLEDSTNDDSDDEGSKNPDEESPHGENEENMEEISDFELEKESEGAIGMNIDMTEASDSTSMLRTPQKRKAEDMEEINVKRSRSTDETENAKHPSSLHLKLKTKTNPGDSCENESLDSRLETIKLPSTLVSPIQSPSPEKRLLEKSVSISPLPQDSDHLSTKIFPSDKKDISRETKSPTPLDSSIFVPSDNFRSEDTCNTESRDSVSSDTTTDTRRSTSQDTDNKRQQILDSKSCVIEENSIKSTESPQNTLNTASSRCLDSSTGPDNPIRRFDSDIRTTHSPDNISEVYENFPQNIKTVEDQRPSSTYINFNSNVVSAAVKEFFRSPDEKSCEVANNQGRDENTAESGKSSTFCADQKENTNNTNEFANTSKDPLKCVYYPGCAGRSTDPYYSEYISSLPCECDEGNKTVESESKLQEPHRPYPGLSLQPLRVKKDARYQKKFYKQKKEIICPVKLGKIIRWAVKISKNESHNVPVVLDSDEEKLSLEIYHELAQELVEGFMIAYNNAETEKSLRDKDKNSTEREQKKKERANKGYIKSSFQEESPSSDDSPESPKKSSDSTAEISRPPSESNLSMVSVSPMKPIEVSPRVVVQAINWNPPVIDLEENEPESDQQLHQMDEEDVFRFIKVFKRNEGNIAYEDITPDEKSLEQGEDSSSFQMGGQQSEASETGLLRFERTGIESESHSETQNVISRHPRKNTLLSHLLDQPISKTKDEREFELKFSNILANRKSIEEPSSSETSNKNNSPEMSVGELSKTLESPNVSPTKEEISERLCFENTSEEEQRAILESLKQSFSEKLHQNYFRQISADNQCEFGDSSSPEENVTKCNIQQDMFEAEQRTIMESLGLIKQSNDPEDQGDQFFSTEYVEIPPEINIYENQNPSEDKPIIQSSTEHESDTELREEKGVSSSSEIPSMEENITDSLKSTKEVELRDQNICLPPGVTQSPTIVNVRSSVDIASERKEACSVLSREETENTRENNPSCSFRRHSSSEKSVIEEQKNVSQNTELESPISPDSADEDTKEFSKPSDEERG